MVINQELLLEAAPIKNMAKTKFRKHGVSYGLTEAGYDIRIKQGVKFAPEHRMGVLVEHDLETGMAIHKPFKGRFTLASSIEEFNMPCHLVGVVHDKSTWARQQLSVFNTVIEPGWKGFLTLELVYHGDTELIIPAGAGIAQVLFQEVAIPAAYEGKYQNQEDAPIPARSS